MLAVTYSDIRPRTLRYRSLSNQMSTSLSPPGLWGHEYIRHLSAELGAEFTIRRQETETSGERLPDGTTGSVDDQRNLANICATFLLEHNAEADAVDLLKEFGEFERVDKLTDLVDENTFTRARHEHFPLYWCA